MKDGGHVRIHQCFPVCDCDMDGIAYVGLRNGNIEKETEDNKKEAMWGSASCSKCGEIAYLKDGGY